MKEFPLLIILLLLVCACNSQRIAGNEGTLAGKTGVFEGNCMPAPEVPPCKPRAISTTIIIASPSKEFSWDFLVDSVVSDTEGNYKISLPPGDYSLFVRDDLEIACLRFECDPDCVCMPFQIVADSTTVLDANLDHATW